MYLLMHLFKCTDCTFSTKLKYISHDTVLTANKQQVKEIMFFQFKEKKKKKQCLKSKNAHFNLPEII